MQSMGAEAPDRALVLLDGVVKKNGELKWAARNEQAIVAFLRGLRRGLGTLCIGGGEATAMAIEMV